MDIAVRAPGAPRWQVAVMLDGPEWSGRPTVADRDSAPTLLRSIMGWPAMVRFWLPSWIRDRAAVLDQIDEAVAEANAAQPKELVVEQPAATEPTADLEIPQPRSANDAESAFAATAPVPAPAAPITALAPAAPAPSVAERSLTVEPAAPTIATVPSTGAASRPARSCRTCRT